MADRTESGISRKGVFSVIYCLPGLYVIVRSVLHKPAPEEARVILALALGTLVVSILVCTALLPALLRRFGQVDRASLWRRAAFRGIGPSTVWTFMWTALLVPLGDPAVRLAVGLAGSVAMLAILWWVDRRWLHLDLFKWRWNEGQGNGE